MQSNASLERAGCAEDAISQLETFLNKNNFSYETSFSGGCVRTYFCEITDSHSIKSTGMGKGFGNQSMASAIAEAIEHYYYENDKSQLVTKEVSAKASPSWFYEGSPNFSEILLGESIFLDHNVFCNALSGEEICYPAFLSNPGYSPKSISEKNDLKKHSLVRYSCNSGIASGLNRFEAKLHGLLELIERDAIGMQLLGTVISKKPVPVKIIKIQTIPVEYKQKIAEIENELDGKFEIYDITSTLNIPTILASLTIKNNNARFFGSGSSIFLNYAFERATMEAVQCFHGQKKHGYHLPVQPTTVNTNDLPKYIRCFMDRGIFTYQGGIELVDYAYLESKYKSTQLKSLNSKEQYDHLVTILNQGNIDVYHRMIFEDKHDSKTCVTQVIAPKLERFYLVASGLHILPAARGMRLLE